MIDWAEADFRIVQVQELTTEALEAISARDITPLRTTIQNMIADLQDAARAVEGA